MANLGIQKLILLIAALVLFSSVATAVSIGISPGRVQFDEVLRGGYSQRTVTITTGDEGDIIASIRVDGDISEWTSFFPNETTFTVSKGRPYQLTIIAQPPATLPLGNYSGGIEIITEGAAGGAGRAGASVKTAVTLLANLEVSGNQVIKCRAGSFSLSDSEIGFPLEIGATVINDGNVRLSPTITVDVWDQLQDKLLLTRNFVGDSILPTTQKKMIRTLPNNLGEGQYWANIKVDECQASSTSTFSIVEKGGIVDKGELIDIINPKPWALTNETLQIIAKFSNNGPRSVNARFKGTIRLDDKIIKLIETDDVIVPPSEVADFDIFFIPEIPGRYTLTGRVIYNKKLTFEKGTIINVNPTDKEAKKFSYLPLAIYIIVIMLAIFMLRKIRQRRS